MTNLEIVPAEQVPAAQLATATSTVVVDYSTVATAVEYAQRAFDQSDDGDVKQLANAVLSLSITLTEIVRGLHHGRVAVYNYPVDGAHLR